MNPKDAKYLFEEINEFKYKPTKWEEGFLQNIEQRVEIGQRLTPAQGRALEEIYCQAVDGGTYQRRQRI